MPSVEARRAAAIAFVSEVKQALGQNLEAAYLYGPTARGEPGTHGAEGTDHDVDLVLVVKDRAQVAPLSPLLGRWIMGTGLVMEVLLVTHEQWREASDRGSAFAQQLGHEGEILA